MQSPEEAIAACGDKEGKPFVIGGEQIYRTFMPMADELYITHVDDSTDKEVDAWMPDYQKDWTLDEASEWAADPKGIRYRFEKWVRK